MSISLWFVPGHRISLYPLWGYAATFRRLNTGKKRHKVFLSGIKPFQPQFYAGDVFFFWLVSAQKLFGFFLHVPFGIYSSLRGRVSDNILNMQGTAFNIAIWHWTRCNRTLCRAILPYGLAGFSTGPGWEPPRPCGNSPPLWVKFGPLRGSLQQGLGSVLAMVLKMPVPSEGVGRKGHVPHVF